jgi:hypothetical protein
MVQHEQKTFDDIVSPQQHKKHLKSKTFDNKHFLIPVLSIMLGIYKYVAK